MIPNYALYGEADDRLGADWLHCETIQARSRLHGFRIGPHRHAVMFQVLHLSGGSAEVSLDGATLRLRPPCALLLPPMVVHGYVFSPDVTGSVLTLFEQHLASVLRAEPDLVRHLSRALIVPLGRRARPIAALVESILAEWSGGAPGRLAALEASMALLLIGLLRLGGVDSGITADGPVAQSSRAVAHAMRYRGLVDRDFREHRRVGPYARELGVTQAHLNRLCRQILGDTALGVIHRRVVLEAKRSLVFTELSAQSIALSLGFEDPGYFARFFRRQTGLPPLAFRAAGRRRATGGAGRRGDPGLRNPEVLYMFEHGLRDAPPSGS